MVVVVWSAIVARLSAWLSGRLGWGDGGMWMVCVRDRWYGLELGGH